MSCALSRPVYWFLHLWVLAYCVVLLAALVVQFGLGELPCPLCMLQRYGMFLSTLGPVWIILDSNRGDLTLPRYQQGLGLAALGALLGAVVAARQIALHVLPGDPGYGTPFLVLHLYSWAFLTFLAVLVAVSGLLILSPVTVSVMDRGPAGAPSPRLSQAVLGLFILLLVANAIMIVFLEGFAWVLPDDPVGYNLLAPTGTP